MVYRRGERGVLCGTPASMGRMDEIVFVSFMRKDLCVRKELIK